MNKWGEFFQQQDGAYCALQFAIVFGFVIFWLGWGFVAIKNGAVPDVPVGAGTLLGGMLASKVWKDMTDYKAPSQPV